MLLFGAFLLCVGTSKIEVVSVFFDVKIPFAMDIESEVSESGMILGKIFVRSVTLSTLVVAFKIVLFCLVNWLVLVLVDFGSLTIMLCLDIM